MPTTTGGVKRNIRQRYGKITATDSAGPLRTTAWIDADIDWPGEALWITRYGIEYESQAKARAQFGWGRQGYYSISAAVLNRYPVYEGMEWNGSCNADIRDYGFVEWPADIALSMGQSDIEAALSGSSATASIDQDASSSAGTPSYSSVADADY